MRSATVSTMSGRGMEERVLIEGNLQKLGRRFKGWHQRYFRIKGSHMYYHKKAVSQLTLISLITCMHIIYIIIIINRTASVWVKSTWLK